MDDLTVMTTSIPGIRWVLLALEQKETWARMKFKPTISRSLCLIKGTLKKYRFRIQGEVIPDIEEQSIKCLGKIYNKESSEISLTTNNISHRRV